MVKYWNEPAIHNYDMRIAYGTTGNADGKQEYIGYGEPGTKDATAGWQIQKLTYNSTGQITERRYAGGSDELDKSWTLRTTYDFSP